MASVTAVMALVTVGPASAAPIIAQSTAQALKVQVLPPAVTVAQSPTPTTAVNTGSPATINHANPAAISLPSPILGILNVGTPNSQGLVVGALSEDTQADNSGGNGTSFACAGTVSQGGAVQIGPSNPMCTGSGVPAGGVTLHVSSIPGLGTALSGLVNVDLHLDSIVAHAMEAPNSAGTAQVDTGGAAVTNGSISVSVLGVGLLTNTLTIPSGPNTNLVTAIVNGLAKIITNNPLAGTALTPLINALNGLANTLEICTNYQPSLVNAGASDCRGTGDPRVPVSPTNPFSVTGLHVAVLGTVVKADLARVTVGPNALALAGPAFPKEGWPIAAGGGLLAIALIVPWYRRRRRNMSSSV